MIPNALKPMDDRSFSGRSWHRCPIHSMMRNRIFEANPRQKPLLLEKRLLKQKQIHSA
jgi:hypothetical protein